MELERWQTQLRLTDIKICDVFRETEVGIDGLEAEGKGRFRAQDRAREGSQTVSVERAGERRVLCRRPERCARHAAAAATAAHCRY